MRKVKTDEEQVATKLTNLVNDLTLDIEQVGIYLARQAPNVSFRRLNEVIDSANNEKETIDVRNHGNTIRN